MLFTQTSSEDNEELCKLDVLELANPPTGDQAVIYEEFKEQLQRSDERWNTRHDSRGKGSHSPLETNKEGNLRRLTNLVQKLEKSNSIDECNALIQK